MGTRKILTYPQFLRRCYHTALGVVAKRCVVSQTPMCSRQCCYVTFPGPVFKFTKPLTAVSASVKHNDILCSRTFSTTCVRVFRDSEDAQSGRLSGQKPEAKAGMTEHGSDSGWSQSQTESDSDWVIRLANENSYLSWCRNTYLASVMGVAILVEATGPNIVVAAQVCLLLGGFNLLCGSASFITNILRLRQKMHMSFIGASAHIFGAVSHLLLWLGIASLLVSYVEEIRDADFKSTDDDDDEEDGSSKKDEDVVKHHIKKFKK